MGIAVYNPKTNALKNYRVDSEDPNSLTINQIWDIFETKSGDIWVGTMSGGLLRFDPNIDGFHAYHHLVDRDDSLADERVWAIEEDHLGLFVGGNTIGLKSV